MLPIGNLNLNLKDVDTSPPSIAVGDVPCKLTGFDIVESENKPGMCFLIVKGVITQETNDTKGNIIKPGWRLDGRFTLPGAPGEDDKILQMRRQFLADLVDAVTGNEGMESRPLFNEDFLRSLDGKFITAVVGKKKPAEDGSYPFGETEVKRYKHLVA